MAAAAGVGVGSLAAVAKRSAKSRPLLGFLVVDIRKASSWPVSDVAGRVRDGCEDSRAQSYVRPQRALLVLLEGIGPRLARLFIRCAVRTAQKIFQKANLEPRTFRRPPSTSGSSS